MSKVTQQEVRLFLQESWEIDMEGVENCDSLFSSGLLDSLSVTELIAFLETRLQTNINVAQLSLDDLDSVDAIVELAGRFQERATGPVD
mgnify:FL=1